MRRTTLLALVAALAPWTAGAFPAGSGRIEVGPAWRDLGPDAGPAVNARFVFHPSSSWGLGLEVGGGVAERGDGSTLYVGDLAITATVHPLALGPVLPYLVGGVGWHVVGIQETRSYGEGGTSGLFLGLGALLPLGERLGVFLEDRWRFAWIGSEVGSGDDEVLSIGGNMIWAGLMVRFDPEPPLGS